MKVKPATLHRQISFAYLVQLWCNVEAGGVCVGTAGGSCLFVTPLFCYGMIFGRFIFLKRKGKASFIEIFIPEVKTI